MRHKITTAELKGSKFKIYVSVNQTPIQYGFLCSPSYIYTETGWSLDINARFSQDNFAFWINLYKTQGSPNEEYSEKNALAEITV